MLALQGFHVALAGNGKTVKPFKNTHTGFVAEGADVGARLIRPIDGKRPCLLEWKIFHAQIELGQHVFMRSPFAAVLLESRVGAVQIAQNRNRQPAAEKRKQESEDKQATEHINVDTIIR